MSVRIFCKSFVKYYYSTPGEVTFVETPPMSPHMVTLVASKFDWYSRSATDITSPVRVFTHTDYLDQVQYVAGEAPKMLKAMETFTGVRYDLPKLDLFAVPDFKSDAVGGWGLNTYRYGTEDGLHANRSVNVR